MAIRNSLLDDWTSEATRNIQPTKDMNGGSAKIDWANPESPSTNPETRREQYNIEHWTAWDRDDIIKSLGFDIPTVNPETPTPTPTPTSTPTNRDINLSIKGNFDMYEPIIDETNADSTFQKAISQLNDSIQGLGSLKLASENYQYTTWSTNVADINRIIKEIQKAYTAGIYDTSTIANQLWVDQEVIRKIQQGKASELVSIWEEFAQEKLKDFFRAEEDYDTSLRRTMEDYSLAKTNLDAQFNSAMQTLRRNLFDEKRAASVWSAVSDRSGSEYMIQRVEKWYQQNMDDLENNYIYSSLTQRASYIRAIQDYNRNITRLWEDFDDAIKSIQLSVLQQFQEIDNKIMTAEDNLKALSKLQWSTSTAMSDAILKYISWIEDANERQKAMQNFIAANYGYDVSELTGWGTADVQTAYNNFYTTYKDLISNGWAIRKWWCGEPVNEYLGFLGSDLTITQAKDLAPYAKDKYPTLWAIVYFDWTQDRATENTKLYWHTWIVTGIDKDNWTITVLDSNGSNKMWLWYTTYKMSEATWYYTPSKTSTSTSDSGTEWAWDKWWYQEQDSWLYENFLQWKNLNQVRTTVEKDSTYWKTAEERRANFKSAAKQFQSEKAKEPIAWFQQRLDTLVEFSKAWNQLSSDDKKKLWAADVLDSWIVSYVWLSWDALRVAKLYNQIKWQAFINWIITSKQQWATYWQLSDNEWRKIEQAATSLSLQTPDDVPTDIQYMAWWLQSFILALGWTPDITSWYTKTWDNRQWTVVSQWPTRPTAFPDLIVSGSSTQFNSTWSMYNEFWTWTMGTWVIEIPHSNF